MISRLREFSYLCRAHGDGVGYIAKYGIGPVPALYIVLTRRAHFSRERISRDCDERFIASTNELQVERRDCTWLLISLITPWEIFHGIMDSLDLSKNILTREYNSWHEIFM